MKTIYWLLIIPCLLLLSCNGKNDTTHSSVLCNVIPQPNGMTGLKGYYVLQGEKGVSLPAGEKAQLVFRHLEKALGNTTLRLKPVAPNGKADICFVLNDSLPDEAYLLEIRPQGISIASNATGAGWFYGIQSLLQLMPAEINDPSRKYEDAIELPALHIADAPRFPHRGAMMDVGRNFLPKEEVMKFLDVMASYKLNKFHFHLTDDQGWRIEIKKYPRLTEIGARRAQTLIGHSDYRYPRQFDGKEQCGYYTQEDIREIVQYAADRFITVIPEIEMPGHASAALAAYPELSCGLGKTYVVRDYFDVFDEVYCPKEQTFAFLQDVLAEVMELFPSHYIHIGGDECPKKAWKKCSHCQALMKREGLPNEEALQSWFIHRIEEFVNSKGRDIIGWDEILEGGLAPNATVMSWRGEAGGIEAARQKHKVIMTPAEWCYFDYYQEDPEQAPIAMGGFLPLDTVYGYNPLPAQLTPEEQEYIIGVQANIWGEYIQTPEHFEYMTFPRLQAMAEVQWTQPEHKDFANFTRRLDYDFKRLENRDINACRNFYEVNQHGYWDKAQQAYRVALRSFCPDAEIHYAIDDSMVTASSPLYKEPIKLEKDATLYAAVFRNGKALGTTRYCKFVVNKATGCTYTSSPEANGGQLSQHLGLTDGRNGQARDTHRWVRLEGDNVQIDLTLHKVQSIRQASIGTLWRPWNELWPATKIDVSVSMDGVNFTEVGSHTADHHFNQAKATRFVLTAIFPETEARFVRLTIKGYGKCPQGYYHEGQPSGLAIDEVELY